MWTWAYLVQCFNIIHTHPIHMLDASLEKGPESSCTAKLMSGKAFVELNLKEVPKLAYMYPKIGIFHTGLTNSILIGKKPRKCIQICIKTIKSAWIHDLCNFHREFDKH